MFKQLVVYSLWSVRVRQSSGEFLANGLIRPLKLSEHFEKTSSRLNKKPCLPMSCRAWARCRRKRSGPVLLFSRNHPAGRSAFVQQSLQQVIICFTFHPEGFQSWNRFGIHLYGRLSIHEDLLSTIIFNHCTSWGIPSCHTKHHNHTRSLWHNQHGRQWTERWRLDLTS